MEKQRKLDVCKRLWNIKSNDDEDVLDLSQKKKICLDDDMTQFSGEAVPVSENVEDESMTSTHDALSNILVLKEIFRNLPCQDLVNCCKVSKTWMAVASPTMCCYRLVTTVQNYDIPWEVQAEKITGFPGLCEKFTTDFPGLTARLNACNHKNRMLIDLKIIDRPYFQPRSDIYIPFLSAHGHRICSLNYENLSTYVDIGTYSRFLRYMPNLEVLTGNELKLIQTIRSDDGERPVLHKLRTIHFGNSTNDDLWDYVLGLAPNVKAIEGFPIRSSELLKRYRNANFIQSLVGYNPQPNWDLQNYETSLRHLADSDVKLVAGVVPNFYHVTVRTNGRETYKPKSQLAETIKSHFHNIFKSGKDTIKEILIPPATYLDYYLSIPFVMSSVEMLRFEDNGAFAYIEGNNGSPSKTAIKDEHRYFPSRTVLLATFPNLKAIEINFKHVNNHVASFFPWDTFGPTMLGSSITKLKTSIVSSYEKLVQLFPHVTHLTIRSTVDHFQRVFPEICHGWSRLQTWTVIIDSSESFHNYLDEAKYSMDSALTGIPKDVSTKLHKSNDFRISAAQVREFQQQHVSLRRLTCLRRLNVLVEESALRCKLCGNDHMKSIITHLAVEYGFEPLKPNLEATLKMGKTLIKY